jgi:hypothetical protein
MLVLTLLQSYSFAFRRTLCACSHKHTGTEKVCWHGNASDLHSEDARFQSLQGHRLFWSCLYSLPPAKYRDYFKSGYEHSRPVPLHFIVHFHPVILCCIVTDGVVTGGKRKTWREAKQSDAQQRFKLVSDCRKLVQCNLGHPSLSLSFVLAFRCCAERN